MTTHCMTLLLTCTLFGVSYCQVNCSFDILLNNLHFPSRSVRPVKNSNLTKIEIGMKLYNIIDLDTSMQSLTTLVWFTMTWQNEFIQWEPQQYCNITNMFLSNDSYWRPDLYIYERIESEDKSPPVPFYSIHYNGSTTRAMPLRIVSSCTVDIFKFPFDTQKCNLTFGSYIHPVEEIQMSTSLNSSEVLNVTRNLMVGNDDWNLLGITVTHENQTYGEHVYSKVIYQITIEREPSIYILTLISPTCFMVILDITSMFILDSGQRLGFKITIVLGFSVLLSILNTMLPNSDTVPVLGIFCCVGMALMVISIMECIVISNMLMLSKSQRTVPSWIKTWIFRYLARVLFFKEKFFMKYWIKHSNTETYDNMRVLEEDKSLEAKSKPKKVKTQNKVEKLLKLLLSEVSKIQKKIANSKEMENIETEWHAAALVLERLALIIYLSTIVLLFLVALIIWLT